MERIKGLSRRLSVALVLVCLLCVSALAGETTPDVSTVVNQITTGLSNQAGAILTGLGAIAAAGLVIFAAQLAIRLGLKAFKSVTGR